MRFKPHLGNEELKEEVERQLKGDHTACLVTKVMVRELLYRLPDHDDRFPEDFDGDA